MRFNDVEDSKSRPPLGSYEERVAYGFIMYSGKEQWERCLIRPIDKQSL